MQLFCKAFFFPVMDCLSWNVIFNTNSHQSFDKRLISSLFIVAFELTPKIFFIILSEKVKCDATGSYRLIHMVGTNVYNHKRLCENIQTGSFA